MKTTFLTLIIMMLFACNTPYKDHQNLATDYQIIPKPVSLELSNGLFLVDHKTKVVGAENLKNEGDYLADMLSHISGSNITFKATSTGNIELKIDEAIENNEGYTLSVTYNKITISGKTAKGVFYGIQTLKQLIPATKVSQETALTIPAVTIKDEPRFIYRGMHLDVARHFFSIDFIKKYIDLLAMHKMNTFHWHLTEDQGWRIEIKKYPKLTQVGSKRHGTINGHFNKKEGNDETAYGGFYTQEDIKEVVKYATERHVTVIPEIELPGHASAAIAAYSFLSCFPEEPTIVSNNMGSKAGQKIQANGTPKIVQETWGVFDDVFCAGNEKTFQFLEDVLAEVIPLFPSEYIHIGGDECPKSNWKRCADCQKRIKDNNLTDEHHLQSYFIQRIEKYLNAKGKKIIGWDEILEGGLAPNATVMSWRGEKGGIVAAKEQHDVIMTPGHSCYFDHYQTENKEEEPLAIGGKTTVADVYAYEPIPKELSQEESKYVLGAQGNVWTEYMETSDHVEYMILPRMTALSEVIWSPKETKDFNDFKLRLKNMKEHYDAMDLNYAKHIFETK
ncbi:beta-N-acetylhexosaminidase [Polaribacter atrinae]|uniref:beta-N-acetylhexosaminidase n=1 Tax=Polaribacter atrinae TaxID=1333662 RepID=A0A176T2T7_9FLAO|nr:beta-N-acetylhexosaminidase [Polaribacter atrinae]OAD42212.1 beta-N-acetylglucosaminidase [Polaribacter atrinae]